MTTLSKLEDLVKYLVVHGLIAVLYVVLSMLEVALGIYRTISHSLFPHANLKGTRNSESPNKKPTVVIVGANFSGLAVLRTLSTKPNLCRIVLIDQREYFEYTPGILRLFCQPNHFDKITKKLPSAGDSSCYKHQFIQGKVIGLVNDETIPTNHQKVLTYQAVNRDHLGATYLASSKTTIPYDYLILATGATYPSPIWPMAHELTLEGRLKGWKQIHKKLGASNKIIILGAGAVGVELAAEIVYHYGKKKQVILIDAQESILPIFPKAVIDYAHGWLQSRGVDIILGRKLVSWDARRCVFEDESVVQADFVLNCFGGQANSQFLTKGSTSNQGKNMDFLLTESQNIMVHTSSPRWAY